jgi:hypothetical protein
MGNLKWSKAKDIQEHPNITAGQGVIFEPLNMD